MPYHAIVGGSAILEDPAGGPPWRLWPGDILLLPRGDRHVLHDGSGAPPEPSRNRARLNDVVFSENGGAGEADVAEVERLDRAGERLDMICGHFVLEAPHHRLLESYLPRLLVVHAAESSAPMIGRTTASPKTGARPETGSQLAGLVSLLRIESALDNLGGRAMLNALSTAIFTLTLRLASEASEAPVGLLALAGHPRLAPALAALFREPERPWSLPELARLCNMSRATLARHFQETLGRSPSELLTDIRMTLAANELKNSSASTAAVAEAVGYQSEAAFQRVFKMRIGMTPARWRRATRSSDS
jgi:AraC family transcriptional activator of mtrCDE